MTFPRLLAFLLLPAVLAACAGGPPKRVFPPQATLQEVRVQADGQYAASVRVQNFSTVPMTFNRLQLTVTLSGHEATRIDMDPALTVGPGSNELVKHVFAPPPAVRTAVDAAFSGNRQVRYELAGRIASRDPGSDDELTYKSALDPVPGLPGVLR